MKAYQIIRFGDISNLEGVELPDPAAPSATQVIVKLHAASLNYRDLLMLKGFYNPKQPLPLIPLSDGAGEVVAVGSHVTRVKIGDRVIGIFTQGWIDGQFRREYWSKTTLGAPLPGMLAEYNILDETGLVVIPDSLSYEEASTLPCAGVTAWNAITNATNTLSEETVLIQGTGGVSLFALQFAKIGGARVIATSGSDEKLEKIAAMGVTDGINYKTSSEWGDRVRELTDGTGVDHVVEVGGSGTLPQSFRAVRAGGRISLIGVLATGRETTIDPLPILMNMIDVRGILVGSRAMTEAMCRAIETHRIEPIIDKVFPFADARAAFLHLESGSHLGKVVIKIAD